MADRDMVAFHLMAPPEWRRRPTGVMAISTGHVMQWDHAHPNFSPDGARILVWSGRLTGGASFNLMLISTPESRR